MAYNMFNTLQPIKPVPVNDTSKRVEAQPQTQQPPQKTQPALDVNSSTAGMDYLNSLYTSKEDEEKLRKASVANQRILAIGDALRHIGNIATTVNYAPAQQFNNPVLEEQARYERGKALRDRANQQYYTYMQQKAAQDAALKKWEQQFNYNLAKDERQYMFNAAKEAERQREFNEGLNYRMQNDEANRKQRGKHYDEMERQGRQNIGIRDRNATNMKNYRQWKMNGGGSGSSIAPLDTPKGRIMPNGRNYSNQLLQMFDYAKSKGYVQESDVARRLREMGFGKDQSDNVKRQMVMDLLRSNQDMGDYASSRLGWSYGASSGGGSMDLGLDSGEEDEMNLGLE